MRRSWVRGATKFKVQGSWRGGWGARAGGADFRALGAGAGRGLTNRPMAQTKPASSCPSAAARTRRRIGLGGAAPGGNAHPQRDAGLVRLGTPRSASVRLHLAMKAAESQQPRSGAIWNWKATAHWKGDAFPDSGRVLSMSKADQVCEAQITKSVNPRIMHVVIVSCGKRAPGQLPLPCHQLRR